MRRWRERAEAQQRLLTWLQGLASGLGCVCPQKVTPVSMRSDGEPRWVRTSTAADCPQHGKAS